MTEIFRTVLNMSITGAYIAAAIIILRIAMKKLPKKYSYLLWAILGIRLICPFSFSSAASLFNVLVPEKPDVSSGQMEFIANDIGYSYEPNVNVSVPSVNNAINDLLPSAEPSAGANPMQTAMHIGAYIWAVGAVAMLVYTAVSYALVKKKVRSARFSDGNVYICGKIETPFVYGLIKPRIYLPENISEEDRPYIIAHEQTHIRRKDHIIKLFAMLELCVHWFNPMVWISYRLMTKDMELSCDEKALGGFDPDVKKAYANALLNISMRQNKLTLGGVLSFGESDIKSRIKGVLNAKKPKVIAVIAAVIAVSAAAVCLLTNSVRKADEFDPIPDGVYTSPVEAARAYLNGKNIADESISELTVAQDSFFHEAWKYTVPPLSEQYGISENDSTVEVMAVYNSDGTSIRSYIVTSADTAGFRVVDEVNYSPRQFTAVISEVRGNEQVTGYDWQEYVIIPSETSGDFRENEAAVVYSRPNYGNNFFNVGDIVTVEYSGEPVGNIGLEQPAYFLSMTLEDQPEDVSDDVPDEPINEPANSVRRVSLKHQVSVPDEYGGYSFNSSAEIVSVDFDIPEEWTADGGVFMLGDKKVLEQNVVYPDSYGLMTEGFTVDMVSGRNIEVLEEQYGGESDPYSYYIRTSMQSYDGVYNTRYFIVQQNGYYAVFSFDSGEDTDFSEAEEILKTAVIAPLHTVIDINAMRNVSVRLPISELRSDGAFEEAEENGEADVALLLPSEWDWENASGHYFGKRIFQINYVYDPGEENARSVLQSGDGIEVIDEMSADGAEVGFDYMQHRNFYGSELYEYFITRGDLSAWITFSADESLTEEVRNAVVSSINIKR